MPPTDLEDRLTLWQFVAGAIFAAAAVLIGVFHGVTLDIFAGVIATSSLIVAVGLELFKGNHTREKMETRFLQAVNNIALKREDVQSVETELRRTITDTEGRLAGSLERFCKIVNDPLFDGLEKHPHDTNVHLEWRDFVIGRAKRQLRGKIHLVADGEDFDRVSILSRIISVSKKYVYAYTHGTPGYLRAFWGNETAMEGYLESQKNALGRKVDVRRIFVITDEVLNDAHSFELLAKTLKDLKNIGMTHLHLATESKIKQGLSLHRVHEIPRSFLVIDDEFVSEAEPSGLGSTGTVAYVKDDQFELNKFLVAFNALQRTAGGNLSASEIDDLRSHLRAMGWRPGVASDS